MAFEGFSKDTLKFLGQLQKNNNRDWFQENKSRFDERWMAPAKEFVISMGKHLYTISPDINAEPRVNASIRRINRDIRFSKNKTPYKDHFDFFFRYAEAGKEGPGYFVRIQQKKISIGGGAYMLSKPELDRFRDAVASDETGPEIASAVKKLRKAGYEVGRDHYKRVPRGMDPDHPRADLLKYAGLYAMQSLPIPAEFHTAAFSAFCAKHFKKVAALSEWMNDHVK